MSDRLFLTGMTFFARHGVLEEEQRLGQRFVVDLEVGIDGRAAAATDDPARCVDYAVLYGVVEETVRGGPHRLIETVAERVAEAVLSRFPVAYARVRVAKPQAPLPGVFREAAVEIERWAR